MKLDGSSATVVAYLGIGGNVGDVATTMRDAIKQLDAVAGLSVLRVSQAYVTPPWGDVAQNDYLNAVIEVATSLSPESLHDEMLSIERAYGRDRENEIRWGPRTLDLDLLLFGDAEIETERLTVPHPRMMERAFVMVPLLELNPIVEFGDSVTSSEAKYTQDGMRLYGRIYPDVKLLG